MNILIIKHGSLGDLIVSFGAISVIRLSGDKTHYVLEKIIKPKGEHKKYSHLKTNRNYLSTIHQEDEIIDEVIIKIYPSMQTQHLLH